MRKILPCISPWPLAMMEAKRDFEGFDYGAGVDALGDADRGGRGCRRCGREEREAQRDEAGAGGGGVDLGVVDEGDARPCSRSPPALKAM